MLDFVKKILKIIDNNFLIILLVILGGVAFLAEYLHKLDASINEKVVFITFLALVWYAEETRKMKNEITNQTQIQQKPILVLYIRKDRDSKLKKYQIIESQNYIARVRNVGTGAAANLKVDIDDKRFNVNDYQQNFLEPQGDEQAFKISGVKNLSDLNGVLLTLKCKDFSERFTKKEPYQFKYKIKNIENKKIEYLD